MSGSFAISQDRSIIIPECSNDDFCEDGKLLEIDEHGTVKELFKYNRKLTSPVIKP